MILVKKGVTKALITARMCRLVFASVVCKLPKTGFLGLARMHRLVCPSVVCKLLKTGFLALNPIISSVACMHISSKVVNSLLP